MKTRYKLLILIIGLLVMVPFLNSCQSARMEGNDSVYVMVYGFDDNALGLVTVFVDGREVGKTDVYGRLIFPLTGGEEEKKKAHELRLEKEGYLPVSDMVVYAPSLVLYYRMGDYYHFMRESEKALDSGNYEKALELIELALTARKTDDALYLKAVILRLAGRIEESRDIAEILSAKGEYSLYLEELKDEKNK